MTLKELEQQSNEQLQALYNSEYNSSRRKAEAAYQNICNDIQEKNQLIDKCVKNLDYDNAVCHEEELANLEAKRKTLKRVLDSFSTEPIYHHDDIIKICDAIDSERKKYSHDKNKKLYHQIKGILVLIDDIEMVIQEYSDMAAEYYKNSPKYKDIFSNPYRGKGKGNYMYIKEHIENALQSLEPFLK